VFPDSTYLHICRHVLILYMGRNRDHRIAHSFLDRGCVLLSVANQALLGASCLCSLTLYSCSSWLRLDSRHYLARFITPTHKSINSHCMGQGLFTDWPLLVICSSPLFLTVTRTNTSCAVSLARKGTGCVLALVIVVWPVRCNSFTQRQVLSRHLFVQGGWALTLRDAFHLCGNRTGSHRYKTWYKIWYKGLLWRGLLP
jgi:hypothetical protein